MKLFAVADFVTADDPVRSPHFDHCYNQDDKYREVRASIVSRTKLYLFLFLKLKRSGGY